MMDVDIDRMKQHCDEKQINPSIIQKSEGIESLHLEPLRMWS